MTVTVHQSIATALHDHAATRLFGLMGDANLFMVDHYANQLGGTFVPVAHEASGVLMAMGYAHVSGEVGVATVTHGPALTNCVTALIEGVKARIPMVLLAGDTPVDFPGHLQNVDQREVIKTTGAGFEQMRSPASAAQDVARAFFRARAERRPVVLNMPLEFQWEQTEHENHVMNGFVQPRGLEQSDAVDEAVGMIASARRPLILAGGGAAGARDQIVALAERLEAPLATTLKGKDLFRGHPANIGLFGTLSSPAAYDAMAQADCLICFGTSFNYYTTDHGKLMKDKRVVRIDADPSAFDSTPRPDAALLSDAGPAAEKILYWLNEAEIAPSGFAPELDPDKSIHYPEPPNRTPEGYVNYVDALEGLEKTLPKDRVLVTDVGRFMLEVWARFSVPGPRQFLPTTTYASVGLGLQAAIGACYAAPDKTVVAFCGDGGFMMGGLNEFHTLVRDELDCIVIVANDSAYGAEHIQFAARQMDPKQSHLKWPCMADVATSMGAQGIKVDSAEALQTALDAIPNRKGAMLIELCLDPADMPDPRK